MISQLLRNKIAYSKQFNNSLNVIENIIHNNISQKENDIVNKIVNTWSTLPRISLPDEIINNISYKCWIDFEQHFTHKKSVDVIIDNGHNKISYSTEFGDIVILVAYIFDNQLVNKKLSILQTKKENKPNEVKIDLHQLYLMQFWSQINYDNYSNTFTNVYPDEFSFYHFILNHSYSRTTHSSICSAPFVSTYLGQSKHIIESKLVHWLTKRKTAHAQAPSCILKTNLNPGVNNVSQSWRYMPKSFARFLKESAYLFIGTNNDEILKLAYARVPNILIFKIQMSKVPDFKSDIRLI